MKLCWILLVVFHGWRVLAADWPQWRGPYRNGVSFEQVFGIGKLVWEAAVGTGFSSVSVSEGRAYTMGNTNNQDTVWCFDAKTGKLLWQHTYRARLGAQWYEGGPAATPTVDGKRVFTISKWGDVFCLDAAKGSILWQRDLRREAVKPNRWGFAGSPLVWGDLVILNAGTAGIALNRTNGSIVWSNGTDVAGYASPVRYEVGGNASVLIFAAKQLVALDPKSGREQWRQLWETDWDTNNSDPLVYGDSIFLSSFSRGCGLLSLREGRPQIIYTNAEMHSHLSPGVVVGDYLYAFNGEAKKDTDFRCIHLPTGQVRWVAKYPEFGSVILADHILLILSEHGQLILAEASPVAFKPRSREIVLNGRCWTPPALAHGHIYVRNVRGDLRCFEAAQVHVQL